MELQLRIIQGPDKGRKFSFTDNNYFLLGRNAKGSEAHYKLSPEDEYVSRNHCIFEIKPPRCIIVDNFSLNGTELKRNGKKNFNKIKGPTELQNGDQIELGYTILDVNIINNKLEEDRQPAIHCIKCGREISKLLENKTISDVTILDYKCNECKLEERDNKKPLQTHSDHSRLIFQCSNCSSDVSDYANNDGRANELYSIASYLCKGCYNKDFYRKTRSVFGNYEILDILGQGGMGVVYKAWHNQTGRLAALKQIHPEFLKDNRVVKQFHREIAVTSMLLHNNVVRLFDSKYIEKTKEFYLVTEYITGGNAEDLVLKKYKGPAPINEACDVICQILYGLEYTHSSTKEKPSIVHRDITPRNILLSNNNNSTNNNNYHFVAKLADYGLAKPLEDIGSFSLTRKNEYAGTHLYMSLEQIKNYKYVKPSTDIYSVGITLYYLLTSKYPFNYPSQLELKHDAKVYQEYRQGRYHGKILKHPVMMVIEDPRIPIRKVNSSIPDPLANMIDTAIQKDEKNRSAFTTAKALREAIQGCMNC